MSKYLADVLILGAGASGLMCAATAGYRGRKVVLLDHAPKAAAKIRISGGGRCNFTNLNVTPNHFICHNPHFVKSALARYTPQDFIDLVERHGMDYEQRDLGKLFCQNRAGDLIHILKTECDWAGVETWLNTEMISVSQLTEGEGFLVQTSKGLVQTQALVVATGARSFPKLKATDLGYRLAKQFEMSVLPTRPGLVPLVFDNKWRDWCSQLSGVSLEVEVRVGLDANNPRFQEPMLFTHQGLSGPAILQASNYWLPGQALQINLLPQIEKVFEALLDLKRQNASFARWLQNYWPKKFVQAWLTLYPMPIKLAEVSHETLSNYAKLLSAWQLYPSDTAGYDKAEVTLGGVDTDEVSSKHFEAKKVPGLFFIGEVLDVTGHLGGYNFQWAWASGYAAGQVV